MKYVFALLSLAMFGAGFFYGSELTMASESARKNKEISLITQKWNNCNRIVRGH